MAQYTVTGSTSVVLVNSLLTPNTVVLLSSIQYPGHIVGIRDTTGLSRITYEPIVVSTTQGVKFYDGTFSTLINQPNGSLVFSSKDSNTWQLLNTVGFFTSLSNAYLSSLTSQFSYINTLSSIQEVVSTSIVKNIDITNSIFLGGNTEIIGNIIVNGPVSFLSSLTVEETLSLSSLFTVNGTFATTSTLSVTGELNVIGSMSTQNSLQATSLVVERNMYARGILLPLNLSVQTLHVGALNVGGGIQVAGNMSTVNAFVGKDLVSLGSTLLQSTVAVGGTTAIGGSLFGGSNLTTGFLSTLGNGTVSKEASIEGSLTAKNTVSTLGEISVARRTVVDESAIFRGDVFVTGLSEFRSLTVLGSADISSFQAFSTVRVLGDASSYGNQFVVQKSLEVSEDVGVGGNLYASNSYASVSTGMSTLVNLGIGDNLSLGGSLFGQGTATVLEDTIGVSSFVNTGTFSTSGLTVFGNLQVLSNITVARILGASTLGAPIDLTISTLTLSNTLYVNSLGQIPVLDMKEYPVKILVGDVQDTQFDVAVEGILQNRSTIDQTTWYDPTKLWYATNVRASTIVADTLLSSYTVGPVGALKPLQTFYGALLTGQFSGTENLFYSSNISTNYAITTAKFLGANGGYKVVNNGFTQWVAVGDNGASAAKYSILTSLNGYQWTEANTGGFALGGRSVAYGGGKWVAVGYTGGAGSIQYSTDGLTWTAATNPFLTVTGGGEDVAYNGTNLWVAAGSNPGNLGIKYSGDGVTWLNATLVPPVPFVGKGVGYGGGRWVASDGTNQMITSLNGISWTVIAGQPLGKTTFAYNGIYWLAGGPAQGANPTTSIHLSPNGLVWIPIQSGGFTSACYDIRWDARNNLWYAAGSTNPVTLQVLQYSSNGLNWIVSGGIPDQGIGRGIGLGTLATPDTDPYFIANMTTILPSGISSSVLYPSTVNVSSATSEHFFGDGTGLSNLTNFRSTLFASSFTARNAYTLDISAQRLMTEYATIQDSLTVLRNPFLSTIELWLAAGYDSQSNGNIQTSLNGQNWFRGVGPSFNYFARSIVGNSNISSPLYVATGGDSRTQHTIQWSENGRVWNPITQGGFDVAVDGVRTGNSVTYNAALNKWVVGGYNPGSASTIFYSSDAKNWFAASNAFTDNTSLVVASPTGFVALGNGVKYSVDGITWANSVTSITLNTAAFGYVSSPVLNSNVWLGLSNTSVFVSLNDGISWQATGCNTSNPLTTLAFGGMNWLGAGGNKIEYSPSGIFYWSTVVTEFAPDVLFNDVAYNSNQARWVAGAVSTTADKSLWTSCNITAWNAATSGGFSTSIVESAAGYGIFTSTTFTFAVGQGSFTGVTETRPSILQILSNDTASPENYVTSNSLSMLNASNVFQTQVRGIFGSASETFHYVAVGNGETPQKTIARSETGAANTWLPAVTGGFSTVGYGVTHFQNNYLAVGDAQATSNTIQYSPDGANWFGTNNASAIRQGGRGIAVGGGTLSGRVVVTGRDSGRSTFVHSANGFSWAPGVGSYFATQGNAVTGGSNTSGANFVAVGSDSRGFRSTILQSADGINWSNTLSGGFTGGGFGIAYGLTNTYVAVGLDANSNKTIQYSTDGGANFTQAISGAFTKAGYAVGFNELSNVFFAVGEDIAARRNATIKYSTDAQTWFNISTGSGFLSQTTLGAAYGLFTQQILNPQIVPMIEFSNLVFYEGEEPLLYPLPTVRTQSSFVVLNETMTMNLSSQMIIGSNVPFSTSTVLTVYGNIYASSFLYTGTYIYSDTLIVSSLVVSTLSTVANLDSIYFTTPSLAVNTTESKANYISSYADSFFNFESNTDVNTNMLTVNNALFMTANMPTRQKTGIGLSTPLYDLDIKGTFGTSSFSTLYFMAPGTLSLSTVSNPSIRDPYFTLYSGSETTVFTASNSLLSAPSTLLINGVLSLNHSTQKVGIYTNNPEFTLDVRRQAYIQTVSTPLLNTSLLFLTLQSA